MQIQLLFTLGSVDSSSASGAEETTEMQIIQTKHNIVNGLNPGVSVVRHQQRFFSELPSPGRSHNTND